MKDLGIKELKEDNLEVFMSTVTENKIDKLLEDISSIKTVINRNKPLLQQILNPAQFRWLGLLAGISITFFFGIPFLGIT